MKSRLTPWRLAANISRPGTHSSRHYVFFVCTKDHVCVPKKMFLRERKRKNRTPSNGITRPLATSTVSLKSHTRVLCFLLYNNRLISLSPLYLSLSLSFSFLDGKSVASIMKWSVLESSCSSRPDHYVANLQNLQNDSPKTTLSWRMGAASFLLNSLCLSECSRNYRMSSE